MRENEEKKLLKENTIEKQKELETKAKTLLKLKETLIEKEKETPKKQDTDDAKMPIENEKPDFTDEEPESLNGGQQKVSLDESDESSDKSPSETNSDKFVLDETSESQQNGGTQESHHELEDDQENGESDKIVNETEKRNHLEKEGDIDKKEGERETDSVCDENAKSENTQTENGEHIVDKETNETKESNAVEKDHSEQKIEQQNEQDSLNCSQEEESNENGKNISQNLSKELSNKVDVHPECTAEQKNGQNISHPDQQKQEQIFDIKNVPGEQQFEQASEHHDALPISLDNEDDNAEDIEDGVQIDGDSIPSREKIEEELCRTKDALEKCSQELEERIAQLKLSDETIAKKVSELKAIQEKVDKLNQQSEELNAILKIIDNVNTKLSEEKVGAAFTISEPQEWMAFPYGLYYLWTKQWKRFRTR